ncbi:DNA (cytosine-5-)-methyltransferase [Treponema sp. UBA6852]|uniref:DNA (cytosine-5-)-methyltransferase n=1 Tax=Treponema sp. UBA6852 TaxID=1947744 RepID=UPI0032E48F08
MPRKKSKANYTILDKYIGEKTFDEDYALLSHYIQLQDSIAGERYRKILEQNGLDVLNFPETDDFNAKLDVPFGIPKNPSFTFIDLFAGIGGFRLAMQSCGGQCVFSSEWDDAAKQTYFENYGEVPFGDITKPETKDLIPEKFDVLCAGFPCQAFSIAGYQKGFDDVRGTLFFDVADILEKHRPKAFYLENVKNLKSHDEGRTFAKIMDVLQNRLGYIVDSKIMNPCEYANVPQNRERIFIVGFDPNQVEIPEMYFRNGQFEFPFPEKVELTKNIHDVIDDSIETENLFYKEKHLYYDRMKDVIVNPDTVYQWRRVYIRENKSGVCPTLTANMGEGGHNVPIVRTSKGIRKLTPEECLGFQGFPVNIQNPFRFPNTIAQSKKYKQAGNSVTEPLIERVARNVIQFVRENER